MNPKHKFHLDGILPSDDSIFVFGSNLAGIHGAGAARVAFQHFGARYKFGIGISGNSYAIPTKDEHIQTLSLDRIKIFVDEFVQFTKENPNLNFFVTRVGCGLAGFSDKDIAPMFRGAMNCSFAIQWKSYVE